MTNPRPHCFDIEVTSRCGLGCPYCYLGKPGSEDMDEVTAERVLNAIRRYRVSEVNLYGGEPFLNFPAVQQIVEGCSCRATIFTNGATATDEQLAWCLHEGVQFKRSTAGCPEAAALTRPGDYTDHWLAEGGFLEDYTATHRLTVTPATARYVTQSVRWLHREGYYGPIDLATDDYAAWSVDDRATYEDEIRKLAREVVRQSKRGNVLAVENFCNYARSIFDQSGVTVFGCGAGGNTWAVTVDGRVVPCHRWFRVDPKSPFGNNRIEEILDGAPVFFGFEFEKWRKSCEKGLERVECLTCPARQCCSRGCPHVALHKSSPVACWSTRLYADTARWISEQLPSHPWWRDVPTACQPFVEE